MLQLVKEFLATLTPNPEAEAQERQAALQLAIAVLLVEVMRVDPTSKPTERQAVLTSLQAQSGLAGDALSQLMARAEQTAQKASDYFQFTSRINDGMTHTQKIGLIESMWHIAWASGDLDPNENHLIGKIAELLYVTQGEYIGAKMRAKEALGLI